MTDVLTKALKFRLLSIRFTSEVLKCLQVRRKVALWRCFNPSMRKNKINSRENSVPAEHRSSPSGYSIPRQRLCGLILSGCICPKWEHVFEAGKSQGRTPRLGSLRSNSYMGLSAGCAGICRTRDWRSQSRRFPAHRERIQLCGQAAEPNRTLCTPTR
jgi:hypothetical protein